MAHTPPTPPPTTRPADEEIRIISHSTLYYWWVVWAVGFLLAFLSMLSPYRMALVPAGTEVMRDVDEIKKVDTVTHRDILLGPKLHEDKNGKQHDIEASKIPKHQFRENKEMATLHMANSKDYGVVFCTVLLLVIFITNVPLRGLWSVIVIVLIMSLTIIFALLHVWENIFEWLSFLDIRINAAGYFVISTGLFIMWLIIFLLFDQQIYMIFTPGQLRVRLEIGEAETAYDTSGMTIQKQRSDLFRHWILGLGSGDLIVKTSGAQSHTFDMPNVLFLGRKVRAIEDMLRSKQVVSGSNH